VSDSANGHRTVVTLTDGSGSSLRAAPRAGSPAGACGAKEVRTVAVQDSPVERLLDVVRRKSADLLLVGSRGPADATRRSECDVLVVHRTG
jgi:hypothetical protein